MCTVTTHHLPLPNHHCPVTIVYPHTAHSWGDPADLPITTEDLRPYREALHRTLCVGTDMPYLRVPRQLTKQGISLTIVQCKVSVSHLYPIK